MKLSAKQSDTRQRTIHCDAYIRIVREQRADGSRIIKTALDNAERIQRLKIENDILARLSGVPGCPVLIAFDPARNELAMEDFGGIALDRSEVFGSLSLDLFLSLAQELARIIASIHQRGVVHIGEMRQEAETALGFARKAGNRHGEESYIAYRQLALALEGKTEGPGGFDDDAFTEQKHLRTIRGNPMALCYFHIYRAVAAALFNDDAALIRNAAAAAALTSHITGFYPTALANVMDSLALCRRAAGQAGAQQAALLERVTANQAWLAARAAEAPVNFGHLYDLVEAERLDVLESPWDALQAFEQAMRKAQANQRPWQAALATERAGRFYLRRGLERAGRTLLARAHELYQQWGAEGKTAAMRNEFPFVGVAAGSRRSASMTQSSGSDPGRDLLDYEALLYASRTLASETSLPRLVSQVVELVGQLTSATDVRFLLQDESGAWFLEGGVRGAERLSRMPAVEAEKLGIISGSAFRLGLKMLKPLASDDAVIDARFSADPHFADLPQCSLLALPMLAQGRLCAFLILENRQYRAAFTAARTETASMLCGQLAVSIENVRLYESLERKVEKRTRELAQANAKLETLSVTDGLTGLANRRRFDEAYQESWRQAARLESPFSVAMLDVDHFKAFNDLYGHQAGDVCLQRIAASLKTAARRAGDLAARYGGEEFVLIFPGLPEAGARAVCENIREAVENLRIPHAENEGCGAVTVSVGVATCFPGPKDDPTALLRQADASLYQAKSLGRNRVVGP